MKKNGLLLTILSIFALTGCSSLMPVRSPSRKGSSSHEDNAPSQSSPRSYSNHSHTYGEWMVSIPATCTEKGEEQCQCIECGMVKTRTINELGHDYQEYRVTPATCTQDGSRVVRCTRCGSTEMYTIKAGHEWNNPATHLGNGQTVNYYLYDCVKCAKYQQIEIKAVDCTLLDGSSIKSGTPNGFFKLNSNGQSASWKFDYTPTDGSSAVGMAYTRGMLDYWSSNPDKPYGIYSTSSSVSRPEGNFDFTVNGNLVDKSAYMDMTFGELTADGEDSSYIGENYSPIALVPVGEITLTSGVNEITYTRTGSYNMLISEIILVVAPREHVHTVSNEWHSDGEQHWHVCTSPNCPTPNVKIDAYAHSFGEKYDEGPATCQAAGSYKRKCTVCEYEKTVVINQLEHNWVVDDSVEIVQPTKDTHGRQTMVCSTCGTVNEMDVVYGQTKETALTVEEAIEIGMGLTVKGTTDLFYFVRGTIGEILTNTYGDNTVTLYLASSSQVRGFEFYRVSLRNGINTSDITVGTEVYGYGQIYRYQENAIEFSGKTNFLDSIITPGTNETPSGCYNCVTTSVNGSSVLINLAFTSTQAFIKIGSTEFNKNFTYNTTTHKINIPIDDATYGTLSTTYINHMLMGGQFNGSYGTQLVDNKNLIFTGPQLMFDCEGTDEQLQSTFMRRYRENASSPWTIDNSDNRILSQSGGVSGSCLYMQPYLSGIVALSLAETLTIPLASISNVTSI